MTKGAYLPLADCIAEMATHSRAIGWTFLYASQAERAQDSTARP
jgi:hypothetical protein